MVFFSRDLLTFNHFIDRLGRKSSYLTKMVSWNEKRQPSKSRTSEFRGPWVRHLLHYCVSHCHWAHICILTRFSSRNEFPFNQHFWKKNISCFFCLFSHFWWFLSFFRKIRSLWNIFHPIDSNWQNEKAVNSTSLHCHWMADANLSKCTFVVIGKLKISLTLPCMETWWKGLKVDWYIPVWWA